VRQSLIAPLVSSPYGSAVSRSRLILGIVATDSTFERTTIGEDPVWVGKCIHCNRKLVVEIDGGAGWQVTVEHIVPRNHGGTDELANLALACYRCNNSKGVIHDHKRADDPKLREIIERLQARRAERWRDPVDR
jgi:5-methylcytosine-specific restriction endonuclease McrA